MHLDSELLFPAPRGGHINMDHWRRLEWSPALRAAGLPARRIYDLRVTFLTWSVEAGQDLGTLAEIAGTSIVQLSQTYVRPTKQSLRSAVSAIDDLVAVSQ